MRDEADKKAILRQKQVKGKEEQRGTDGVTRRYHSSGVKPGLNGDGGTDKERPSSCDSRALSV